MAVPKVHFWRVKQMASPKKTKKNRWITTDVTPERAAKGSPVAPGPERRVYRQRRPNNIKHALNLLGDSTLSKSLRLNCLQFIDQYLEQPPAERSQMESNRKVNKMKILKAVIKTFVDPKEALRIRSIELVGKYIGSAKAVWDFEASVKYIVPIIVHCIFDEDHFEQSEVARLRFVGLLQSIVSAASSEEELKPICGDLISILMKLLTVPHPECNVRVCSLFIALSGKMRLNAISSVIVEKALPLLGHRQSTVRIHAIQLIESMLLNGGHEAIQKLSGFREHNVVPLKWWFEGEARANYFGALCTHSKLSVRKAFHVMVSNVMSRMPERYDYKTLLLSYVVSGLQDHNQDIQSMAFDNIERIGKMHEKDEYNDLKRTLFFQKQAEEIRRRYLGDDDEFPLPFPFKHRPCLGSRILFREHFGRVIFTALSELKDWKLNIRVMAVLLVRNLLIYSEEYCTQHTETLLVALRKIIADQNSVISQTAKECSMLIGKFVYPMVWIDYLSDAMFHEFEVNTVEVLHGLIMGCPLRRVHEFGTRTVVLIEYAMHEMNSGDAEALGNSIREMLCRVRKAMEECDDGNKPMDGETNFEFSSEYLGFHLEIVDETKSNELGGDGSGLTLSERIERLLSTITATSDSTIQDEQ